MITLHSPAPKIGNRLFQMATAIAYAEKHGHEFTIPEWRYSEYFAFHDKLKRQKPLQAAHQIDRLALQLLQAPASHSLQPAALLSQEYAHCVFVQPALNPHQTAQMRVQVTC